MKLSRSWALIGGFFLASTAIMAVVNPKIRETQSKNLRAEFASGEKAIDIQLPRAGSKEPITRQMVWLVNKGNGYKYIEFKDSRDPRGIGKMPCDPKSLEDSIKKLREKLSNYDSVPLDQRDKVKPSFSIAVSGQVVCGYKDFDQLNSPENYGITFFTLKRPMHNSP